MGSTRSAWTPEGLPLMTEVTCLSNLAITTSTILLLHLSSHLQWPQLITSCWFPAAGLDVDSGENLCCEGTVQERRMSVGSDEVPARLATAT